MVKTVQCATDGNNSNITPITIEPINVWIHNVGRVSAPTITPRKRKDPSMRKSSTTASDT